jgi:UDP-glucuronate 4-epimerase
MNYKILITGSAGFIGFHLTKKLLERGDDVIGIDNLNEYYEPSLKKNRLNELGIIADEIEYNKLSVSSKFPQFKFVKLDLLDKKNIDLIFSEFNFDMVVNLAAQPGVRYSLINPYAYTETNITGFLNILENCRNHEIKHLVFASSSSVYGLNEIVPFSVKDNVDHPVSLYAATKKANELMAHAYSHLYNIPVTGLRFFTVYGPWGRPDMAYYSFTRAILAGKTIDVYNEGNMERDFTYIDDIVEGIEIVLNNPPRKNANWNGKNPDPSTSSASYKIYNIGNNNPIKLDEFIGEIEKATGVKAKKNLLPLQSGDMLKTWADIDDLIRDFNYMPRTTINVGIKRFVDWYTEYYKIV